MRIHSLKYLLVYLVPFVFFISMYAKSIWSFFAVFFLFIVIPFFELFTKGSTINLTKEEEEEANNNRLYDWILYGLVPAQYFLLYYFLTEIGQENLSLITKIAMTSAFGMACGVIGINKAHELGHRNTWYEQFMSKALLLTTLYLHFFIEHNRGHHKNVSTDEDPASSRYGEILYAFYFRSIINGWFSAWKLEANRLKKINKSPLSLENQMLRFQIIQLAFVTGIFLIFGLETMLFFLLAALIGILLLETVNYIEHYGLRRKQKNGVYQRTLPIHSWNSNHPLGRLFLLELTRHSDHHYLANRKFQILRNFEESPQMPTGYPGMMFLALFPPIWFKVMHKRIADYKMKLEGQELA